MLLWHLLLIAAICLSPILFSGAPIRRVSSASASPRRVATAIRAVCRAFPAKGIVGNRFPPFARSALFSFTYYTGFRVNSGEYKLMGLAPYGQPRFVDTILDNLLDLKEDGTFRLDMSYFSYCTGLTMTNSKFDKLLGGPPRQAETKLTQRHMDIAASIQVVTEEVVLRLTETLRRETGEKNLCLPVVSR